MIKINSADRHLLTDMDIRLCREIDQKYCSLERRCNAFYTLLELSMNR